MEKDLSEYHRLRTSPDGLKPYCKECACESERQRRGDRAPLPNDCLDCGCEIVGRRLSAVRCVGCAATREAQQKRASAQRNPEAKRLYYARNRERVIERSRIRRISQPGYKPRSKLPPNEAAEAKRRARRKWASANPEKVRAKDQRWDAANRSKRTGYVEAYRQRHPERVKEGQRKRRHAHPEKHRLAEQRRRARLRDSCSPGVTPEQWAERVRLFAGCCAYCHRPADTVDHCIPISRGGKDIITNVVPACRSCNSSKRDKTPSEWRAYRAQRGLAWSECRPSGLP